MNATEVKGSQGAGLVGGSDSTNQAVDDAQDAARAAAEAARKAAEAAAAAAAERNAEKARELEAKAKALAETAAKAAQKASNAAAKLAGALEKLENRGKSDLKLAAAVEKATAAAKAARSSSAAAMNSAAAATRSRAQKPVDRYESMKDKKLEYGPPAPQAKPSTPSNGAVYGPPAPQAKPSASPTGAVYGPPAPQPRAWHPPMAPPTSQPAWNRDSFAGPSLQDPFYKPAPKPLTPEQRLELVRERKLEQLDRGAPMPPSNPVPQGFSVFELGKAGPMETKSGVVVEGELYNSPEITARGMKLTAGVEGTAEYQRSLKASQPKLQPGGGMTVTFEVKQEVKGELSPGINVERGLVSGRAATKHALGRETTYEFTVPADKAELYQRDPLRAPDPFNPKTLPEGATLVIKMDDVRSDAVELELGHAVGAMPSKQKPGADGLAEPNLVSVGGRIETGGAEISGRSVAIERLEGDTVRLIAGPTEGLKGSFALSGFVGDADGTFEGSIKAEVERSFATQNLRTVDLDLSKPGAAVVYEHFLRTGQLPAGGGSAAVGGAEVYQSSFKAGGKLEAAGRYEKGSASVAVNTEYGIDQKQTFGQDGSISSEFTVSQGDRTVQISEAYTADGKVDPKGTGTRYLVHGAPQEVAEGFQRSFSPPEELKGKKPAPISGSQQVELSLTPAQATELSGVAKAYVADWEAQNNQSFNSATEPLIWALANAQDSNEASTALADAGGRNEDYYALTRLADFHGQVLPGTVRMVPSK
ncbi:hypothetical protein [Pyxidicoccus xibeiensis]|uniref:hypothetical protein n=1 Tax=Pyxidicoccus xibeiensis TaxID=2906759 RepID=UPI0020A731C4|nr:hypothetical protein [Pyxidicoccus xibeiensis]MCP3137459.1 hypothetical protein [Pyxidicoccus xibeiensis]